MTIEPFKPSGRCTCAGPDVCENCSLNYEAYCEWLTELQPEERVQLRIEQEATRHAYHLRTAFRLSVIDHEERHLDAYLNYRLSAYVGRKLNKSAQDEMTRTLLDATYTFDMCSPWRRS